MEFDDVFEIEIERGMWLNFVMNVNFLYCILINWDVFLLWCCIRFLFLFLIYKKCERECKKGVL